MNTYKITNLTNQAGKRDVKYNSTLDIVYVDSMMKKTVKIKPGETVYLTISSLPLSVHRLRVKKLISVVEIGKTELKQTMNVPVPTTTVRERATAKAKTTAKPVAKKKSTKKVEESEVTETE